MDELEGFLIISFVRFTAPLAGLVTCSHERYSSERLDLEACGLLKKLDGLVLTLPWPDHKLVKRQYAELFKLARYSL